MNRLRINEEPKIHAPTSVKLTGYLSASIANATVKAPSNRVGTIDRMKIELMYSAKVIKISKIIMTAVRVSIFVWLCQSSLHDFL
jgi:hypothetical protein